MPYYITDDCISCAACEMECPERAISEGGIIYVINPEICSGCAGRYRLSRCAEVCPVNACRPLPSYLAPRKVLLRQ